MAPLHGMVDSLHTAMRALRALRRHMLRRLRHAFPRRPRGTPRPSHGALLVRAVPLRCWSKATCWAVCVVYCLSLSLRAEESSRRKRCEGASWGSGSLRGGVPCEDEAPLSRKMARQGPQSDHWALAERADRDSARAVFTPRIIGSSAYDLWASGDCLTVLPCTEVIEEFWGPCYQHFRGGVCDINQHEAS
jgi:hypothetical protein